MSGTKTRHFYNNLLNTKDARYLEIGTWKGSSVCSAMCGNNAKVVCIDNWSEFGGSKSEFLVNFNKFKGENDATFIENDCYKVDDWNWRDVRDGTLNSIQKLNLKVLYEKQIRLTWDNSHTPQPQAKDTWWNGIYVAILQK